MKTLDLNSTMHNVYTAEIAKIDRRYRRAQKRRHANQKITHGWKAAHVRFAPYGRAVTFATRSVIKRIAIASSVSA